MTLHLFTQIHVAISLIGIVAGLLVMADFVRSHFSRVKNIVFLVFTLATSVTGFFFPFHGFTPGIAIGIVSLPVLGYAILSWRRLRMKPYMVSAIIAEYLNILVLIVQLFQKVPSLHALAPKGSEPIVAVCQLVALAGVVLTGRLAFKKYRSI